MLAKKDRECKNILCPFTVGRCCILLELKNCPSEYYAYTRQVFLIAIYLFALYILPLYTPVGILLTTAA